MPPTSPVRVLHVDDDPQFAELVASLLEQRGFDVLTETRPEDVLETLEETRVDCVVSDYDMPGMTGIDLLEATRTAYDDLPFILFTGKGTEEVASHAISAGVTDYLQKEGGSDQFTVLANRIENAVEQYLYGRQFETLVENLPGIVYRAKLTPEWPIEFMGGDVMKMTGYSSEAFESGEVTIASDLEHPDDLDRVWNEIQSQLETGETFEVTYRIIRKTGELRWVRERGQVVEVPPDGEPIIEGLIMDITDSEQRQHELHQRRVVFRTLVDNLPVGILVEDESREILAVNSTLREILTIDQDRESIIGADCQTVAESVKHRFKEPESFIEGIEQTLSGREPTKTELELADGTLIERTYIPYALPDGEASMWVYRDVTDERERERLLEGLFEDSLQGIGIKEIVTDDEGNPVDYIYRAVNETFAEMTGLDPEEVIGKRVTEVLPGIEETNFIERFGEVALTGESVTFEEYSEPLGRHYEVSAFSPQPGRCITIFSDITERKEHEQELARFKTFVENSSDIIVHIGESGKMLYQSPGTMRVFNHEPGVNVGKSVFEFIHPDDRERVFNTFVEGLTNPEKRFDELEMRLEDADGGYVWVEAGAVDQSHTDVGGIVVSLRDISERKAREEELKRYGETLEALQKMTRTLFDADDEQDATEIALAGIEDILSFEIAGLWRFEDGKLEPTVITEQGRDLVETPPVYSPDNKSLSWEAFESGEIRYVEDMTTTENRYNEDTAIKSEIIAPLGQYGVLNVGATRTGAFSEDDLTLVELWASTVTTVLSRIEREQELRSREREIARERDRLEEFFSVLSHDLRNPLNVAVSRLELLGDEVQNEHLDAAQRGLDRMERLLEDLLVLVREGNSVDNPDAVQLCNLAHQCWGTVQMGDATLDCQTEQAIIADRSRLAQVFENLFRNAVEHAELDSELVITVGDLSDGFYIEDNGPGIPEADRVRVFESGYSTTQTGTGLGLAIVRRIVQAHGWEIRATDAENGGARFEITGVEQV